MRVRCGYCRCARRLGMAKHPNYRKLPDLEDLRARFAYDPATGLLTHRRSSARKAVGTNAGHADTHGYLQTRVQRRALQVHRVIWKMMTGEEPLGQIDHINRNRADNRWNNLRIASGSENQRNTVARRTNRLGLKGVFLSSPGRYGARIKVGPRGSARDYYLGCFDTPEEASAAYLSACQKLVGDFARV